MMDAYKGYYQVLVNKEQAVDISFITEKSGEIISREHKAYFDKKEDSEPMIQHLLDNNINYEMEVDLDSFTE